jgi:ubiquinone biosynthesis protein
MVGYLDEELKNQVGNFTIALVQRDLNSITKNLVDMGIVSQQIDIRSLKRDISRLIRRYYNVPMSRISVGKALNEALALAYKYHVKVPADVTLLSKSMVTMESIAQQLDPDLSIVNVAEPFGKKLIRERFSPQHLRKSFTHSFAELVNLTENLPRQLNRVARVVGDGNLELKVRSVPNETNTSRGEGFGNRLALAIVVAASIVGSVILLQMKRGPMLFDLPILGIVGLFVSLILGIWLVISIASSSRL